MGEGGVDFHSPGPTLTQAWLGYFWVTPSHPCPGPTRTHSLDRDPFVTINLYWRPVWGVGRAGAWGGPAFRMVSGRLDWTS